MVEIFVDCLIMFNDDYLNSNKINIKETVEYSKSILNKKDVYNILNKPSISSKINYNLNSLEKNNEIIIRYFDIIDANRGYFLLTENSIIELKNDNFKSDLKYKKFQLKLLINIQNDMNQKNIDFYKKKIKQGISKFFSDLKPDPEPSSNSIDIIFLSSNPLVEIDHEKKIHELSTIYDNVSELATISKALKEYIINLHVEFNVLTEKNLISAVKKKTKILHLLCKTSYDKDKKLFFMFENENFELVKIKEENLHVIFKDTPEIKEFKEKTLLIINTQFLEDSLEIFKKLGFEKIIIEHSIPTNTYLTNRFNKILYDNLTQKSGPYKTQDAYNNAKPATTVYEPNNKIQLCCCFHKHLDECKFKTDSIQNYEIAHFNHLRYKCSCSNIKNDFINHPKFDENNNNFPYLLKRSCKKLICCNNCKDNEHNNNSCFQCFFKKDKKDDCIFFASKFGHTTFNKKEIIDKYKNLNRLVGRNKIIYDIICDLKGKKKFINVYGEYDYNYFGENLSGFLMERNFKIKYINLLNENIESIPRNDFIYIIINININSDDIISDFITGINNDFQLILLTKNNINESNIEIKFKTYELKKLNENDLKIKFSVEKKLFTKSEFLNKIENEN